MLDLEELARCCADIARRLPTLEVRALALRLAGYQAGRDGRLAVAVAEVLPQPQPREVVGRLVELLEQGTGGDEVLASAALLAAAASEARRSSEESTELVWTGVEAESLPLRRTEQVLLELVQAARDRVLIVSYAVYRARTVGEMLLDAIGRGVRVTLVLEPEDPLHEPSIDKRLAGLHPDLRRRAEVLIWPAEHRKKDEAGNTGILHAKCAVADGRALFISSANLTETAMTCNMELGVLVRGGPLPAQAERHFVRLRETGVLVLIAGNESA